MKMLIFIFQICFSCVHSYPSCGIGECCVSAGDSAGLQTCLSGASEFVYIHGGTYDFTGLGSPVIEHGGSVGTSRKILPFPGEGSVTIINADYCFQGGINADFLEIGSHPDDPEGEGGGAPILCIGGGGLRFNSHSYQSLLIQNMHFDPAYGYNYDIEISGDFTTFGQIQISHCEFSTPNTKGIMLRSGEGGQFVVLGNVFDDLFHAVFSSNLEDAFIVFDSNYFSANSHQEDHYIHLIGRNDVTFVNNVFRYGELKENNQDDMLFFEQTNLNDQNGRYVFHNNLFTTPFQMSQSPLGQHAANFIRFNTQVTSFDFRNNVVYGVPNSAVVKFVEGQVNCIKDCSGVYWCEYHLVYHDFVYCCEEEFLEVDACVEGEQCEISNTFSTHELNVLGVAVTVTDNQVLPEMNIRGTGEMPSPYYYSTTQMPAIQSITPLLDIDAKIRANSKQHPQSGPFVFNGECIEGYELPYCTVPPLEECPGGWSNFPLCDTPICLPPCNESNGLCTEPNTCLCDPINGYEDLQCNIPKCAPECHPSHGYCSQPFECECLLGYSPPGSCNETVCKEGCMHGICEDAPFTCSCIEFGGFQWGGELCDTVLCPAGWRGENCSIAICHELCINGNCTTPQGCELCFEGWEGEFCDDPICHPFCIHGECSIPNGCETCHEGWEGAEFCDVPICHEECLHGNCTSPGGCEICEFMWTGDFCSIPECHPLCIMGNCTTANGCEICDPGYVGPFCDIPDCTGCFHVDNCTDWGCTQCSDTGNYYGPTENGICRYCHPSIMTRFGGGGCVMCEIDSPTLCELCDEDGFTRSEIGICLPCDVDECRLCNSRNSSICEDCHPGFFLTEDKLQCKECEIADVANCIMCSEIDPAKCSRCEPGFLLTSNNTCVECLHSYSCINQCSNGLDCLCEENTHVSYFVSSIGGADICLNCSSFISNCFECDESATTCSLCIAPYFLTPDQQSCTTECELGYFVENDYICSLCNDSIPMCETCRNESLCEECFTGYTNLGEICKKCDAYASDNCILCDRETGEECIQCEIGYALNELSECILCDSETCSNSCDDGLVCQCDEFSIVVEFYGVDLVECTKCLDIISNCSECVSEDECEVCESGFYLTESKEECVVDCGEGNFENESTGKCQKCNSTIPKCLRCESLDYCYECEDGFTTDTPHENCVPCNVPFCEICSSVNPDVCLWCEEDYSIGPLDQCRRCNVSNCSKCEALDSNLCEVCSPGFIPSISGDFCSPCNVTNCEACVEGFLDVCENCIEGFTLYDGECVPCIIPNCIKCAKDDSMECEECEEGHLLNGPHECRKCDVEDCTMCTFENSSRCQECNPGLFLGPGAEEYECVPSEECGEEYFGNSDLKYPECQHCKKFIKDCIRCTNSTTCLQIECPTGRFQFDGPLSECEKCSKNSFPDFVLGRCRPCDDLFGPDCRHCTRNMCTLWKREGSHFVMPQFVRPDYNSDTTKIL